MSLTEINFDGIIGPTHNYSGLSFGNLASATNAGKVSHPRAAALQGIEKMRHNLDLGLAQGFFVPHPRPNHQWLVALGTDVASASPQIRSAAFSASAMWAANAATVSPAPDAADGLCHLTPANLRTMAHRSHEWTATLAQLRLAFSDRTHFAVHPPVPATFADEGAANHMRLCREHGQPGLEIFVYGQRGGQFPVRQHLEASAAVARLHRLDADKTIFVSQSEEAIAAGAFHNDVVAVANENLLFAHERAFEDKEALYDRIRASLPEVEIVEVPAAAISLEDAIASYLFNAQLVTLPDGGMALVLPSEARELPSVWNWLEAMVGGNGPIRKLAVVDVRQSMANGGGPACLRLRVVANPATVDQRFIATPERLDHIAEVVQRSWPEEIAPAELSQRTLVDEVEQARRDLLEALDLSELA